MDWLIDCRELRINFPARLNILARFTDSIPVLEFEYLSQQIFCFVEGT